MEYQGAVESKQADAQQQEVGCAKPSPDSEPIHLFRKLQQRIGNRAVGRQIQVKLKISEPGDLHEQEADRVADQVMRMPAPSVHSGVPPLSIQRKCGGAESDCTSCPECAEKDTSLSTTFAAPQITPQLQRQAKEEEEDEGEIELHTSAESKGSAITRPTAESHVTRFNGGGSALPESVRSIFEPRLGGDFSNVRVHTDARAAESARSINALAYTVGRDVVFGAGQYSPDTIQGQKLLAHELTHVMQQGAHGPVAERRAIAGGRSELSPLPELVLQRTVFTPGAAHNHQPSRRWSEVQSNPNSRFLLSWICGNSTPRMVADTAMDWEFCDKPLGLRHLRWYLGGGGADFNENDNLARFVRTSEHFRRNFAVARRGQTHGFMQVPQAFFGPSDEDFRFSFGAIDRMDFEIDEVAGTVHLWFKDRYEFHPVYPFYTLFPDDEVRETNCVHAAMVELKDEGAADFWMIGETTLPLRAFAFSPSDIIHEESADSIRSAADFLDTLRQQLQVDRIRARGQAAAARGPAEGSRLAHPILNQRGIRAVLLRGKRIYDAQRRLLNFGHPLLERFRSVYFNFLGEVLAEFNEALALSRNDRAAETEEQNAYGESLVLWMEASPMREAAMHDQATFTAAFQSQEANLTQVLTNVVPYLNLAQPGMPDRARDAINQAVGRNPDLIRDPARTWATGPVPGLADAALAQIDQANQTMNRGRSLLRDAIVRLNLWLQTPAQPIDVADRVDELFRTRDVGYGQLLRDRLQLMLDNVEGRGQLFAHTLRPGDTSNCATVTTLGQMPQPYEFIFCRFSTNVDSNASTLLHELAHAVVPGRGTRGSAASGAPIDRAYSGERLMLRMTTEEALNNAESYAQLVEALTGLRRDAVPSDTVTGCADSGPLMDAIAMAQSAHRRAWTYLEPAADTMDRGAAIEPWLRDLVNAHLGSPSDRDLRAMLRDFGNLEADAFVWHTGHTFSCPSASACPANALAFDNRRIYRSGTVASRSISGSSAPRICPPFFSLATTDDRARAAHVIVSRSFGDSFLIHKDRAWGYAALALALYRRDIGAPPAANLAEHQAADQPASP